MCGAHPNVISRLSIYAVPLEDFLIRVDQYFASRSLTRNSFRLNSQDRSNGGLSPYNDGYYTLDLSLNYEVNRNFLLYVKCF